MNKIVFLFAGLCVGLTAALPAAADALWDRAAEKARRGEKLLSAETTMHSEVLRGNGSVYRSFNATVTRKVEDGRVVRSIVTDGPAGKAFREGEGGGSQGNVGRRQPNLDGGEPGGPRALLEGSALSPFAAGAKVEAVNPGEKGTFEGEDAVRYRLSWTDEGGYAFSGEVWISSSREVPIQGEYVMEKRPWGAEIKKLRASVRFSEAGGLPVRSRQIVEATISTRLFISIDLRSTSDYSRYFEAPKEND